MTIGEKIRQLRIKNGYSQVDLAMKADVSKQTLYKYEHGIINNIPADKIERIAEILNTTPSYLVGWDDDEEYKAFLKGLNNNEVFRAYLKSLNWDSSLSGGEDEFIGEDENGNPIYTQLDVYTLSNGNVSFKMSADEFERMMNHSKNDLNQYILNLINEKSK